MYRITDGNKTVSYGDNLVVIRYEYWIMTAHEALCGRSVERYVLHGASVELPPSNLPQWAKEALNG